MAQFVKGTSGNPAGRPRGAENRGLQAARRAAEEVALPRLIAAAEGGDMDACKAILSYGLPRLKPASVAAPLPDYPAGGSLIDQIRAVLTAVASGDMSPTAAAEIAGVVGTAARIEETELLRGQVDVLTRILRARKDE